MQPIHPDRAPKTENAAESAIFIPNYSAQEFTHLLKKMQMDFYFSVEKINKITFLFYINQS
jgi:hypothetical protein